LKRALCLVPDGPNYHRGDFIAGLTACGLIVVTELRTPAEGDVLVIWNRSGWRDTEAKRFEAAGAAVIVAENGYLGKRWREKKWFSLSLGHHAGAGVWPDLGPDRWDSWNVRMEPWRDGGTEVVVLGQRGIGEPGIGSPAGWQDSIARLVRGRIRAHPGASPPAITLVQDLASARCVVTWNSGGALVALLMGVPVFYAQPQWIGASAARHINDWAYGAHRGDRVAMFQRLAWAMWTADELRTGDAFEKLLRCR
jgi:hypothetical protein